MINWGKHIISWHAVHSSFQILIHYEYNNVRSSISRSNKHILDSSNSPRQTLAPARGAGVPGGSIPYLPGCSPHLPGPALFLPALFKPLLKAPSLRPCLTTPLGAAATCPDDGTCRGQSHHVSSVLVCGLPP